MLENHVRKFSGLRTDRGRNRYPAITNHRAPHKPFLVLSIPEKTTMNKFKEMVRGILETEKREKLKDHIQKKIEGLKEDIKSYQTLTQPISPDNAIGRLTRMEAINSKSINEAALNNAKQTLSRMERALTTINDPDFGMCRECDAPIPFARLMIVPESDLCVQCAEAMGGYG